MMSVAVENVWVAKDCSATRLNLNPCRRTLWRLAKTLGQFKSRRQTLPGQSVSVRVLQPPNVQQVVEISLVAAS